jgi:putative glycosyltransferase (TIGR04348 family)
MRIRIVTPEPPRGRRGNGVTAMRWAQLLRQLGHTVQVAQDWQGEECDALIALHARRSAGAIARFRVRRPKAPLIVALTGTDIYRDLPFDADASRSLELASRLVVLQPLALEELEPGVRSKARVVYQSATAPAGNERPRHRLFEVLLLSHVRAVKDPLVVARAARQLGRAARLRVVHYGGVAEARLAERLARQAANNPHYEWRGEVPRWQALRALARADALVVPSRLEGGANVISEALACGVAVLATRIPGSVGLLGDDHPGYFPVGDHRVLAELLSRIENDGRFLEELAARSAALAPLVEPARERAAWEALLAECFPPSADPTNPLRRAGSNVH